MDTNRKNANQSSVSAELARLVADERAYLRRYALGLCHDISLADDLAQECMERALTRLHLWQNGTNLRAWLSTMLRNLHINGLRRHRHHVRLDDCDGADLGSVPARQIGRMQMRDLRRALSRLPSDQREMVVMVALRGASYEQAARNAKISVGTVKSRLSRARDTLRRLMEGEMEARA
ncbi:RNA polymerase sigma factor [Niveispirillum lacus]|nr:sigma-70 family RNA polymerase sigma factor [Niveispirillum lacus]